MKLTLSASQFNVLDGMERFVGDYYDGGKEREKGIGLLRYPYPDQFLKVGFGETAIWDSIDVKIAKDMADDLKDLVWVFRDFLSVYDAVYDRQEYQEHYRELQNCISASESINKQIKEKTK